MSPAISGAALLFQSTLSMRRATRLLFQFAPFVDISIHALHEESDVESATQLATCCAFQSTLSMRRATISAVPTWSSTVRFQSTLSMRRATFTYKKGETVHVISIHALHEESDTVPAG